jgi:hypothetical protein
MKAVIAVFCVVLRVWTGSRPVLVERDLNLRLEAVWN